MSETEDKLKPFNFGELNVMATPCDECLFSKDAIVDDKRRQDIIRGCSERDTFFICHKATIEGDLPVCCRAFFDSHNTTPIRLANATGALRFIDEKDLPKLNPVGHQTTTPDIELLKALKKSV